MINKQLETFVQFQSKDYFINLFSKYFRDYFRNTALRPDVNNLIIPKVFSWKQHQAQLPCSADKKLQIQCHLQKSTPLLLEIFVMATLLDGPNHE